MLVLYHSRQFAMSNGSYDSNLGSEILILAGDIRSRNWPNISGSYNMLNSDSKKFEPYINCLSGLIMTFFANPHFILQISYAKTFKMKYTGCQYDNIIQKYS